MTGERWGKARFVAWGDVEWTDDEAAAFVVRVNQLMECSEREALRTADTVPASQPEQAS